VKREAWPLARGWHGAAEASGADESEKTMSRVPDRIQTAEELDDLLSRPAEATIECVMALEGDILIIGAG